MRLAVHSIARPGGEYREGIPTEPLLGKSLDHCLESPDAGLEIVVKIAG